MFAIQNQKAQIYLNDSRGKHELNGFRSLHTFNFGNYQEEHRQPFGDLYVLNDDTLAGGRSFQLQAETATQVLLLPVVGAVSCNKTLVRSGEILSLELAAGADLTVRNPYAKETDLVNFLQLWFTIPNASRFSSPKVSAFGLDQQQNRMIDLGTNTSISMGKYKGRTKDIYSLKDPSAGIYAFVIQGAFEVEDRLLHARDGLALEGFEHIEFEALSNDAILLLIESKEPV